MVNKPKLNQPDVEYTTTFTGESITINMTIPTKQFKDIFVTGTSVEDQQSIVDSKRNHVELNHKEYGNIKIAQDVIIYNDKVYTAMKPQLTLDECIKEWEERGWEFIDKDGFICFRTKIDNREKDTIIISKKDNEIYFNSKEFNYDLEYEETALCLSFELYNLLTKTLKALEV